MRYNAGVDLLHDGCVMQCGQRKLDLTCWAMNGVAIVPNATLDLHLVQRLLWSRRLWVSVPIGGRYALLCIHRIERRHLSNFLKFSKHFRVMLR